MSRILLALSATALAAAPVLGRPGPSAPGRQPARVEGVAASYGPQKSRVSIRLDREASYSVKFAGPPALPRPTLFIAIEDARLAPGVPRAPACADGRLSAVRVSQYGKKVRVVVELEPGTDYALGLTRSPFRIVIEATDREPLGPPAPEELAAPPAPKRRSRPDRLKLSGWLKQETAYRIRAPDGFSKIKGVGYLAGAGKLSDDVSYRISGRLWYDAVYGLTRRYPDSVKDDQALDRQLRDAYLDVSHGDLDLRLGKQTIVWGEAVGLFFADVVNAKDLREFVLPDFEQIRIPQWAAQAEYSRGDTHAEAVWLPVLEFNRLGDPASEFFPPLPGFPGGVVVLQGERRPAGTFRNSEFGGRLSHLVAGWDLSAFYLHTWDLFPTMVRSFGLSGATPAAILSPEHRRLDVAGGTFAKDLGPAVLKGEAVYDGGKFFSVLDPGSPDGLIRRDSLDALLGLDGSLGGGVTANVQVMERAIFGYEPAIFREKRLRTSASLWLKAGLRDNTVEPELLIVRTLGFNDLMARPKLTWKFGGRWQAAAGADFFAGLAEGFFGAYAGKTRVFAEGKLFF